MADLDRLYGGFPAHEQGQKHIGKHHDIAHRQHGQYIGDFNRLFVDFDTS